MDEAKYWRVYYKIQELLSREFLDKYEEKSDGGVRKQSTLPPKLNKRAHKIANYIMKKHEKKKNKKPWTVAHVTKEIYHQYLDELDLDMRNFVDYFVVADNYFLAVDIQNEEIIGGFATRDSGELKGLFSLEKGYGRDILKRQTRIAGLQNKEVHLDCIGKYLRNFYEKEGFEVYEIARWDERLAPKEWNSKRFGFPCIYKMKKKVL